MSTFHCQIKSGRRTQLDNMIEELTKVATSGRPNQSSSQRDMNKQNAQGAKNLNRVLGALSGSSSSKGGSRSKATGGTKGGAVNGGEKGSSVAVDHAEYVTCEGRYEKKSTELEHKESGNMPLWAKDNPKEFWSASDELERANGKVYREIEVALPRELNPKQRLELIREFVSKELKNHPYTYAIHNKLASDGKEQPHAHIMFSERQLDGIERSREQFFKRAAAPYRDRKTKEMVTPDPAKGGTKKAARWAGSIQTQAKNTEKVRERWAKLTNHALENAGRPERVDHRSLVDQGIDREPGRHLGPTAYSMEAKGIETDRGSLNRSIKHLNRSKWLEKQIAVAKLELITTKEEARQLLAAAVDQAQPKSVDQVQPVFVPEAQSEALPPLSVEPKAPIQQPVVDLLDKLEADRQRIIAMPEKVKYRKPDGTEAEVPKEHLLSLINKEIETVKRQREREAQAVAGSSITDYASVIARQYREYAKQINHTDPDKARTLTAICNAELNKTPNAKKITLPHPSASLDEIRAALKLQRTGGRGGQSR